MPPRKKKEILIVVMNVGNDRRSQSQDNSQFLNDSKQFVKRLIERKIFFRPNDEVGLIIFGADETDNALQFDNIVEYPVRVPTWENVKQVSSLERNNETSTWVEAIYVGLEYIKNENVVKDPCYLILVNNFQEDPNVIEQFNASDVVEEVQRSGAHLIVVGEKDINEDSNRDLNPSEEIIKEVCDKSSGKFMTLEEALSSVRFMLKPKHKHMPWRCMLDLAGMKIPTTSYVKITNNFITPSWKKMCIDKQNQKFMVSKRYEYINKNREVYDNESIIYGYKYGGQYVPLSLEDENEMKYETGEKCLSLFAFTRKKNVNIGNMSGRGTHIILPASERAKKPFYSLLRAMIKKEMVAIVRKIYRKNSGPKMGVLIPHMESNKPWCFIHIQLGFAKNQRIVRPKPTKSYANRISQEQDEALDDLIQAMMISDSEISEDKNITYEPGSLPLLKVQHFWNVLSHRALNPDKALPQVDPNLQKFHTLSDDIKKKSEPVLEKIRTLFMSDEESDSKIVEEKKPNERKEIKETPDAPPIEGMDIDHNDVLSDL
ncbi:X-ray repair cross-complementing protein 5 isoform X2 [Orussus abietinus]|uniref:X-ray repair cross-complementing protein 5 isoform X2 n=1 Tax=Orussus abietinus TaxID=222816 RepID=UPI000626553A|nr:X-ray repair cross-complementing protein 5 isoform X2 [Orussus abietinus]